MTEPTTAAGRALLATSARRGWVGPPHTGKREELRDRIEAIEAEAAAPYREALERIRERIEVGGVTGPEDDRYVRGQHDGMAYSLSIVDEEARALLRREVGEQYDSEEFEKGWRAGNKACLLPDDDTAVERLAAALGPEAALVYEPDVYYGKEAASVIIAALREGGQA